MNQENAVEELKQWVTPEKFVEEFPQIDIKTVRYSMRNNHVNGLREKGGIRVIGKKNYVHRERFANWLINY